MAGAIGDSLIEAARHIDMSQCSSECYVDTVRNGDGCLYRTTAHDASYWDYSTGFRCCADARP